MKTLFRFIGCEPLQVNCIIDSDFYYAVLRAVLLALKDMGKLTYTQYFLAEEALTIQHLKSKKDTASD